MTFSTKLAHLVKVQHPNCHVVAIDWGPWDGGMVTPALKQMFAERNIHVIPIEVGTWLLVNELTAENFGVTQTVVGGRRWLFLMMRWTGTLRSTSHSPLLECGGQSIFARSCDWRQPSLAYRKCYCLDGQLV